ncbi:hypothetical protein [Okeania hirsuta]|uniref:hypothetical protein n=1 Tax=Okeania hirsuta TaxID=1458930 RepID=UPI001374ED20|nr:hypothetical protein [Okeania hirsuta]
MENHGALRPLSLILGDLFCSQFPLLDVFGVNAGIYIVAIVFRRDLHLFAGICLRFDPKFSGCRIASCHRLARRIKENSPL